jgi:hypothetical protein
LYRVNTSKILKSAIMKRDDKLAQMAGQTDAKYSVRKKALDDIKDKNIVRQLAEDAQDEWIKLEAAIISQNKKVLEVLKHHSDERICLESAIELNDQAILTKIVLQSGETLHRDIALNYITKKEYLLEIIEHSTRDNDKVEAALNYGDREFLKELFKCIKKEELKYRIARFTNDFELLYELFLHASDSRIRKMAEELTEVFDPEYDFD